MILLTAAGTLGDRLAGLSDGADDYVVKPFEPRELLARIRAVLRRLEAQGAGGAGAGAARPALRMGRVHLRHRGALPARPRRRRDRADRDGVRPARRSSPATRGRSLSRSRLAELAHGRPLAPGDRSIDIRITRLRAKIGEDARTPRTLRTVHGEGYVFDPDG